MAFVTLDPDGMYDADGQLNTIWATVNDHRQNHQYRANRTHDALESLLRHNFSELDPWQSEQFWESLALNTVGYEFSIAGNVMRELRSQTDQIVYTLAQRHAGVLASRLMDLDDPIAARFDNAIGVLSNLSSWLTFSNMWGIIEQPWAIDELLNGASYGFDATLEAIAETRTILSRLWQRELLLIDALQQPLSSAFQTDIDPSAVSLASSAITAFAPVLDPGGVVTAGLDFYADKDHSAHSLAAHLYGLGAQAGLDVAVPELAAANVGMASIAVGSAGLGFAFDAAGRAQGGPWGARLEQTGHEWKQTSADAGAWGSLFTDVGAVALDLHAGTLLAAVYAPELAPAAFTMESMAGSNTSHLGGDFNRLGEDALSVLKLPLDLSRSANDSVTVFAGDSAQWAASQFLPPGAQQRVSNALYDVTSALLMGR